MTASNRELIRRALINVKLREVAEMDRIAVSEKNISEDSLTRLRVQVMMSISRWCLSLRQKNARFHISPHLWVMIGL